MELSLEQVQEFSPISINLEGHHEPGHNLVEQPNELHQEHLVDHNHLLPEKGFIKLLQLAIDNTTQGAAIMIVPQQVPLLDALYDSDFVSHTK